MTSYNYGDIVLVPFPFTDFNTLKQRPAIVISSNAYCRAKSDLIIMAITSRIRTNQGIGEFQMDKWQEAGLLKPSVVKPVITTITKSLIRKTLGQLEQADREQLKLTIENILG